MPNTAPLVLNTARSNLLGSNLTLSKVRVVWVCRTVKRPTICNESLRLTHWPVFVGGGPDVSLGERGIAQSTAVYSDLCLPSAQKCSTSSKTAEQDRTDLQMICVHEVSGADTMIQSSAPCRLCSCPKWPSSGTRSTSRRRPRSRPRCSALRGKARPKR